MKFFLLLLEKVLKTCCDLELKIYILIDLFKTLCWSLIELSCGLSFELRLDRFLTECK